MAETNNTNVEATPNNNQAGAPAKPAAAKPKMHTVSLARKAREPKPEQVVANITHRSFPVNGVLIDVPINVPEGSTGIEVDDATYKALQDQQLPEGYSWKK